MGERKKEMEEMMEQINQLKEDNEALRSDLNTENVAVDDEEKESGDPDVNEHGNGVTDDMEYVDIENVEETESPCLVEVNQEEAHPTVDGDGDDEEFVNMDGADSVMTAERKEEDKEDEEEEAPSGRPGDTDDVFVECDGRERQMSRVRLSGSLTVVAQEAVGNPSDDVATDKMEDNAGTKGDEENAPDIAE